MMPSVAVPFRFSVMSAVLIALTTACANVHSVRGEPDVTIALKQRPGSDPACVMSEPDTPSVVKQQKFAFYNRTGFSVTLVQNDADVRFATLRPGQRSSAMVLKSAQGKGFDYYIIDPQTRNSLTCKLLWVRLLDP